MAHLHTSLAQTSAIVHPSVHYSTDYSTDNPSSKQARLQAKFKRIYCPSVLHLCCFAHNTKRARAAAFSSGSDDGGHRCSTTPAREPSMAST
mmetsp:Transcript_8398/g.21993  ORF Transcript_8398/g.21993 Transcript_8398/m.21993 type:complete len:92 (+) Transcript_8398:111-386(+)